MGPNVPISDITIQKYSRNARMVEWSTRSISTKVSEALALVQKFISVEKIPQTTRLRLVRATKIELG